MKSPLLMSVIIAAFAVPAFAQTPVQQVRQDNHELRQDVREVHQDQRQVAVDKQQLVAQHKEVRALGRAEDAAVKRGDLGAAQRLAAVRAHKQHAVHQTRRALKHDRQLAVADKTELAHDLHARNHDAAGVH